LGNLLLIILTFESVYLTVCLPIIYLSVCFYEKTPGLCVVFSFNTVLKMLIEGGVKLLILLLAHNRYSLIFQVAIHALQFQWILGHDFNLILSCFKTASDIFLFLKFLGKHSFF